MEWTWKCFHNWMEIACDRIFVTDILLWGCFRATVCEVGERKLYSLL